MNSLEAKYHAAQSAYATFYAAIKAGKKVGHKGGHADLNRYEVTSLIGAGHAAELYTY